MTTPSHDHSPAASGETLKPCPFCGREVTLQWHPQHIGVYMVVRCAYCDVLGPRRETEAEARAAWNRRTPSPEQQPTKAEFHHAASAWTRWWDTGKPMREDSSSWAEMSRSSWLACFRWLTESKSSPLIEQPKDEQVRAEVEET